MAKNRIVVGIDFSEPSMETARWAARQFAGHELVLAHVIAIPEPPPLMSNRYPRHDLLVDTVRAGAEQRMRELASSLGSTLVWPESREGPVAHTLNAIAADYEARFIVVGAHGERPRVAGVIGTTAQQVAREARVPVLLVTRPDARPIAHVLAAVDDETLALEALRWALALSGETGRVTALHVSGAGMMSHALSAATVISGAPPVTPPVARPSESTDRWVALARAAGIETARLESEEAFGDAVTEILGAADRLDADLIVMGRRAAGGLRRAVLGSVTDGVLRLATRNVLVVPEPDGTEAHG